MNHALSLVANTMHAQLSGRMAISTARAWGWNSIERALDEYRAAYLQRGYASAHAGQGAEQMTTVPNQ